MKKFLLALALMGAAACPALAADLPAKGMSVKQVQAWIEESGYEAQVGKDDGDEFLKVHTEDGNFEVHFYDCKDGACASIQLIAGFDVDGKITLEQANAWNDSKRYIDCFIDDEGDPWFTYDINLSPGGTRAALDDNLGVWLNFLPDMRSHIGW